MRLAGPRTVQPSTTDPNGPALLTPPSQPDPIAADGSPIVPQSTIALRTGGTDVAGPGAGPGGAGNTTLAPTDAPNTLYQTGLPGITIGAHPLAPSPTTGAPPGTATAATTPAPAAAPGTAPPAAAPPGGAARPPVITPPPALPRAIPPPQVLPSGLTVADTRIVAGMVQSGTPTATVATFIESAKQRNTALQQQYLTNSAAVDQANFARQQWYTEQLQKTGWVDAGNGMMHNPYTGESKYAGPPSPRFGPQTVDPATGKPAVPMAGGGGVTLLPVPERPAGSSWELMKGDYKDDQPQLTAAAEHAQNARTSQIRWQTMLDLADKLSTGAGGATRAQLANLAETAGFPGVAQTLIAHTSDGDAAAAQEFTKLSTQAAGADARATAGGGAGLGSIKLYQSANPNIDLRPGANKGIIGMQLIAAQADADYNTEKVKYGNEQAAALRSGGNYLPLSTFEQKWQTQRNPQVYAAAMGALAGQPVEKWAKGLSDDPNDPNSEYKRALDVVSRASPSANVNAKSGRISMQPQGNQGSQPVAVKTPADAAALPPGTPYTTPDGRTFTR